MTDRSTDLRDAVGDIIAQVARDVVRPLFRHLSDEDVQAKGFAHGEVDYVTKADLDCEAALAERLAALAPGVPLVGEEGLHAGTAIMPGTAGRFFICDPIDGTRHFRNGNERYSIMLALVEDGQATHAWIYAPEHGLMADAALGLGARLDRRSVRVDPRPLAAGDGVSAFGECHGRRMKDRIAALVPGIRQANGFGAGMDVVDIMLGRSRGMVQSCASIWDILPGQLIMHEAGLITGRFDQDPNPLAMIQWTYALPDPGDVARFLADDR